MLQQICNLACQAGHSSVMQAWMAFLSTIMCDSLCRAAENAHLEIYIVPANAWAEWADGQCDR